MGEDVVHYILALCIVVKKYGGQPIHLTVMLSEQLFEFTLFCHTLLIHTKTELLNLSWHFFCEITTFLRKSLPCPYLFKLLAVAFRDDKGSHKR